jgi:hypothetical protein
MSWIRSLVMGFVVAIAAGATTWFIAIQVAPPRTASGHPTMAIGHAMITVFVAALAFLTAVVVDRLVQARRRDADIAALERGEMRSLR